MGTWGRSLRCIRLQPGRTWTWTWNMGMDMDMEHGTWTWTWNMEHGHGHGHGHGHDTWDCALGTSGLRPGCIGLHPWEEVAPGTHRNGLAMNPSEPGSLFDESGLPPGLTGEVSLWPESAPEPRSPRSPRSEPSKRLRATVRLPRLPLRTCPRLGDAPNRSHWRSATGENLGIRGLGFGLGLGLRRRGLLGLLGLVGLRAPRCRAALLASIESGERQWREGGQPRCGPVVCSAASAASAAAASAAASAAAASSAATEVGCHAAGAPGARGKKAAGGAATDQGALGTPAERSSTPMGGGSGTGWRNEAREEARKEALPMPTPISDSDDARPMPVSDERRADGTWSEPVPSSPPAAGVAVAAAALAAVAAAAAPAAASTVASRDVLLREMALNLRPPSDESRSSAPTPPSQSAKRLLARCSVAGPRRCARSAESCRARVAATASAYASLWERRTSPSLARLPLVCPSGRGQSVAGSAGALESSWPLRVRATAGASVSTSVAQASSASAVTSADGLRRQAQVAATSASSESRGVVAVAAAGAPSRGDAVALSAAGAGAAVAAASAFRLSRLRLRPCFRLHQRPSAARQQRHGMPTARPMTMFEVTSSGEPSISSRFWPFPSSMGVRTVPGIGAAGGGREGGGGGVAGGGGGVEGRDGVEGGEDGGAMVQKIGAGEAALSTVAPMASLSAVAFVTTA